jgi:hypothetical protein
VCSGTIVKVANGFAYVLTAATCCTPSAPSVVVMGNDYSVGEAYINSPSSAVPPTYAVIPSSVKWDPNFNPSSPTPVDDFCMLRFNAPAGTLAYSVATGSDGLSLGSTIRYVGFGVTSSADMTSSQRRQVTASIADLTATTIESTSTGKTCFGDFGGAVLVGSSLVGTIAYGDQNCSQYSMNMRVTSESGTGGFISNYLQGPTAAPALPKWALGLLACGLFVTALLRTRRVAAAAP